MKIFQKIAELIGRINGIVLLAAALGIVLLTFIIGLIVSFTGELSRFKSVAKKTIANPTVQNCNAVAHLMPIRVRKQYERARHLGKSPSDAVTADACVYGPFRDSAAARFPGIVMAVGVLAILLSFFAVGYIKTDKLVVVTETEVKDYSLIIPVLVTAGVLVLRLLAGLVSTLILKSGVKMYGKYIEALDSCMPLNSIPVTQEMPHTGEMPRTQDMPRMADIHAADEPSAADTDTVTFDEPQPARQRAFDKTFDAPERISVELDEEEIPQHVFAQQPVFEPTPEPETESFAQPVAEPIVEPITVTPAESEAEIRAKARAEAIANARRQQAEAEQRAQQAHSEPIVEPVQSAQTQAPAGSDSADEVIARIETINREGGSLAQMKEVALLLQKERAKPENKTPAQQRKLNEALASLLKAMSRANKK